MTTKMLVLWPHVVAGTLALLVQAVPLLATKGGSLHRRVGWVFVLAMGMTSASGMALGGLNIAGATRPAQAWLGAFLIYVGLLTGASVWKGMRVLRLKDRTGPHHQPIDLAVVGLVLAAAIAALAAGLASGRRLWLVFGAVGIYRGWSDLRYWRRAPQERRHWWFQHMGDMIGTVIAALTAFFVLNSARLGLGPTSLVVWLAPSAIGIPGLWLWRRYYRRRFRAAGEQSRLTAKGAKGAKPRQGAVVGLNR
jgi:uncharacterized membrane protein